ncbi:hypothetical protein HMPREF1215_00636 [Coprococcus sp. HPP0074]|jgi:ABC-type phosphate transport system auxiliary subunit|nr:hypothetical protein HMPREF1215_00636 [Coprococcus sp. HPP0074]DAP35470.1 MAG TPA: Putative tail protein [Caudoviricetes sp.]
MSSFEEVKLKNPYGIEDSVLKIVIESTDSYRLPNLINESDTYIFVIWHRTDTPCDIQFTVFGDVQTVSSSSQWTKYIKTISVNDLSDTKIDITPPTNSTTYFYEAYLSRGSVDTSWTPAPEDNVEDIIGLKSEIKQTAERIDLAVGNLQGELSKLSLTVDTINTKVENQEGKFSEINQKVDEIELGVYKKKDVPLHSVRYIRDWLDGNNVDSENKWMECKVIVGVDNIALNIMPTSDVDITNPSYYTDGLLTDNQYTTTSTGNHYLQLDLGKIRKDIDYIQIWHDYSSEKYFNSKVEVSEDGQSWYTLYDSKLQGTYKESANGKIHYVNDSDYLTEQLAKIDIDINKVSASVANAEGKISEMAVKQNEVELRVSDTEKDVTDIVGNMLPDIENQISANQSALEVALESIKSTVTKLEGDVVKQSQEIQDANGWKFIFSSIGVKGEGIPEQETAININGDGLSVTRLEDKGYKTVITGNEFGGYYNNGQDWVKVFSLDEDMVRTKRLMAERGCDFMSLKIVPVDYSSMGVKGLAFVKSGGNS